MTIQVTNRVNIYEQNGNRDIQLYRSTSPILIVASHTNDPDRIHLRFSDPLIPGNVPIDIVVLADDLMAAVQNAQRTGKR